jgi:hypothetical protein
MNGTTGDVTKSRKDLNVDPHVVSEQEKLFLLDPDTRTKGQSQLPPVTVLAESLNLNTVM